jgi:pantoate--beta-alanine ligase
VTPRLVTSAQEFRAACGELRSRSPRGADRGLALVPTMGALHAGHRALMRRGASEADAVAVTIFVNPTQFGPNEDFTRYPRDLASDLAACAAEEVALVFAPEPKEMYPAGDATRVRVARLSEGLCGKSRPGHFEGVATIVAKLFALAGPCTAIFGRKDYQQLKVVERLARDLLLPVNVLGHPTQRDTDGLALSSRNRFLGADERETALAVPRALATAAAAFEAGERDPGRLVAAAAEVLGASALKRDYLELLDAEELSPLRGDIVGGQAALFIAAYAGNTRLIDNHVLGADDPPRVARGAALQRTL